MAKAKETADLAARLVVHGIPERTKPQRTRIAAWLRKQADAIEKDEPSEYSTRYVARLEG